MSGTIFGARVPLTSRGSLRSSPEVSGRDEARMRKKRQRRRSADDRHDTNVKKKRLSVKGLELPRPSSSSGAPGASSTKPADGTGPSRSETWESDSGFASDASPPSSGRCSPLAGVCPSRVVAIDCEMVGTGPKGHRSELARCSILNYHGDVVYDKYILPVHPVMDYRTRWSGIRKRDLKRATPFLEARGEILDVLRGKVVIGHALCNDFLALGFVPPGGLIRDTSSRLFKEMCGFHNRRLVSLKSLSLNLLNRRIQDGKGGHCSVEDAQATLDLYKLVEEQWEQIMASRSKDAPSETDSTPSLAHYMQDEYWPEHMMDCSQ